MSTDDCDPKFMLAGPSLDDYWSLHIGDEKVVRFETIGEKTTKRWPKPRMCYFGRCGQTAVKMVFINMTFKREQKTMKIYNLVINTSLALCVLVLILLGLRQGIVLGFADYHSWHIFLIAVVLLFLVLTWKKRVPIPLPLAFLYLFLAAALNILALADVTANLCWKANKYELAETINSQFKRVPIMSFYFSTVASRFKCTNDNRAQIEDSLKKVYGSESVEYEYFKQRVETRNKQNG